MSNFKQFVERIDNESTGEVIPAFKGEESFYTSSGYFKGGSILLQSAHSYLYQNIGTIPDSIDQTPIQLTSGTSNNINDLIHVANTFIAVGNNGTILTSSNGVVWTTITSGTSNNLNSITSGNNTFVVVGNNETILSSTNGVTWTRRFTPKLTYVGGKTAGRVGNTTPEVVSLTDLTGGAAAAPKENDVVFVAVATGSTAQTSMAVTGYTQIASLYANDTYDTNLWVGYRIMESTPNTTITIPSSGDTSSGQTYAIQVWRNCNLNSLFNNTAITTTQTNTLLVNPPAITTNANSILLVVGAGGHIVGGNTYTASYLSNFLTSSGNDETTDSTIGFGSIFLFGAQTYDPAAWTFGGGDNGAYSCASVTIALNNDDDVLDINSVVYGNNTFIAVGPTQYSFVSTNGSDWTKRYNVNTKIAKDIIYANNTFVVSGDDGFLATSSNGFTWTTRSLDFLKNDLTYVGGKVGTATGTVSLTNLTGGISSAPAANDVVFVAHSLPNIISNLPALVSGYTQIARISRGSGLYNTNLFVGYKIMGSTPDTSITIPSSAALHTIQVWRNCDLNNIFDANTTTFSDTSSTVDPPAITTTSSNTVLLIYGSSAYGNAPFSYTAPYLSNFLSAGTSADANGSIGMGSIALSTPQTYNPAIFTDSIAADSGNAASIAVTTALRKKNNNINTLLYANNTFFCGCDFGIVATSPDGITWTQRTTGLTQSIYGISAFQNDFLNIYAITGIDGDLATSYDGINWIKRSSETINNLNEIIKQNTSFFIVGDSGTIMNYKPFSYEANTEFALPTSKKANTYFDIYIKS